MAPFVDVGTSTTENRKEAKLADPNCQTCASTNAKAEGIGIKQNRKPSGKRRAVASSGPKQITKAPTHELTTASMPIDKRMSATDSHHRDNRAISAAKPKNTKPLFELRTEVRGSALHWATINAMLIGRIRRM